MLVLIDDTNMIIARALVHCTRRGLDLLSQPLHQNVLVSQYRYYRCRFTNWPIRCERGAQPFVFLAPIWLAFASYVVLLWSWLSRAQEMDIPGGQWNTQKDVRSVMDSPLKGYQVEALETVCLNKRDTLTFVPSGIRKFTWFEGIRMPVGPPPWSPPETAT